MKEFLNPLKNGGYELSYCPRCNDSIEIPSGADSYNQYTKGEVDNTFFLKLIGDTYYFANIDNNYSWEWYGGKLTGNEFVLWRRSETEYLMQGKNGDRLMESVGQLKAGKEKHSHYRKNVKHLDFIDPYRIAQLYDLHPCADHIAKKALCTGKRGHKDLMRDIQDIIDTAERWKQMIQEDQNAI